MNYLWVVEMLCDGKWEPTVGAYLSRERARQEMRYDWKFNNPTSEFRIRKYVQYVQEQK